MRRLALGALLLTACPSPWRELPGRETRGFVVNGTRYMNVLYDYAGYDSLQLDLDACALPLYGQPAPSNEQVARCLNVRGWRMIRK